MAAPNPNTSDSYANIRARQKAPTPYRVPVPAGYVPQIPNLGPGGQPFAATGDGVDWLAIEAYLRSLEGADNNSGPGPGPSGDDGPSGPSIDYAAIDAARASLESQYGAARQKIGSANSDLLAQYAQLQSQFGAQADATNAGINAGYAGAQKQSAAAGAYMGNDLAQQGFSANPIAAQQATQQAALGAQQANQLGLAGNLRNVYAQQAADRTQGAGLMNAGALNELEMAKLAAIADMDAAAGGSGGGGGRYGSSASDVATAGDAALVGARAMPLPDARAGADTSVTNRKASSLLNAALYGNEKYGLGHVGPSGRNAGAIQSRYLRAFDALGVKGNRKSFKKALATQTKSVNAGAKAYQKAQASRQKAKYSLQARDY